MPAVEKSVLVRCDPARAFAAFTAEIAQWWPMQTHSVAQAQTRNVAIEPRAGGRIYETAADGTESDWGRVLAWSPPAGFSMTWHPGRAADPHTVVELSFAAERDATRVRLVHRGWEALGAQAAAARESYDGGWETVFVRDFAGYLGRVS
ncbi:MAG: hypothetical protein C0484_21835 [Rhodospirillum sp.]|nr:hypothetical protein [Rhodospirillum sp.]